MTFGSWVRGRNLKMRGIRAVLWPPGKNAAILEASKAFSNDLMKKYNIPLPLMRP